MGQMHIFVSSTSICIFFAYFFCIFVDIFYGYFCIFMLLVSLHCLQDVKNSSFQVALHENWFYGCLWRLKLMI